MRATINGTRVTYQVVFLPGASGQGYWKSKNMVYQLEDDVIPLFKLLHPNMTAVFLFDQSRSHKAYPEDTLIASRMNMNPIEVKDSMSSQGKYRDNSSFMSIESLTM
jgi:hypothetical protein